MHVVGRVRCIVGYNLIAEDDRDVTCNLFGGGVEEGGSYCRLNGGDRGVTWSFVGNVLITASIREVTFNG